MGSGPSRYVYNPYSVSTSTTFSTPAKGSRFSGVELLNILAATVVLTLDLTLIVSGLTAIGQFTFGLTGSPVKLVLNALPIAVMMVLTGFLSHEMAHKFTAQAYGLWSEFRMSAMNLLISLFFSIFGFLFAAPGATYIRGASIKRQVGLSSLAGPLTNFAWAAIFFGAALIPYHYWEYLYLGEAFFLVAELNIWWAIFNMIPFGPLDGKKVFNWNVPVWLTVIAGAIAFYIFLIVL